MIEVKYDSSGRYAYEMFGISKDREKEILGEVHVFLNWRVVQEYSSEGESEIVLEEVIGELYGVIKFRDHQEVAYFAYVIKGLVVQLVNKYVDSLGGDVRQRRVT